METATPTPEPRAKRAWTVVLAWIGGISAALGCIAAVSGAFGNVHDFFHLHAEREAQMAVAQNQSKQGDYQASVNTYADILKADSLYRPALDQQLQTTMLWAENFHAIAREGQDPGDAVAPQLDQVIAILDAGLARAKGTQAADVQAHLGWAHWLNQHIAAREFGPVAEQDLRAALATDPNNVYANAMLGNWMLQNSGDFHEAVAHFHTAVATGQARPLVRAMQLGGLVDNDVPGDRAELVQTANEMRKDGEALDGDDRSRVLAFCCDPTVTDHSELTESLSAVPPDDAWQTYLWLDNRPLSGSDAAHQLLVRDYISANLLEIAGKRPDALAKFLSLQQELKNKPGTLQDSVNDAVKRLSQHQPQQ